ncbi:MULTISPECIES: uroporphyrinogen-III synthase [Streptomyces]|uniref:uroporphyrinogen-III synthase n=1 Tax=Streptomyces TaxID=1883 RepID=UPI0005F8FAAA|nr:MULTISPECIES: uroporphyrinogen-III synthase [Streptomyces]KJY21598.1 bifunctional uroporphyrinogen-III synthetase/response regulator domain protein [Streptomyces sp. NRRL S-104]KOU30845.1 bifunctional uroporphyrinogen-III synthetase/response regulator domain protein [Streptomyces sp. WM6373]KOU62517.1 bifunctional uroporphyrinogen-III synthetase/response regulator domain protein [Streptomyces sp. IGB124]KOU75850.1 bifunctional uroporphyrinogen-III synthetase/response regulator domain protein
MDDRNTGPLAGFTVGVTAARRADELIALLRRRGASVLHAPALRIVPLADDTELLAATKELIGRPPDVAVATTAIGFRGWVEAADGWGVGEELLATLRSTELLARGPKVKGAIRAAGLVEEWSPESESLAEVLERLLAAGVAGRRIALQLHGEPLPGFVEALRAGGAEVVVVPVYRWMAPEDLAPLDRLLDAIAVGGVDAVSFTSAPAAASLLSRAGERGMREAVLDALRGSLVSACVGPVTAVPLQALGVDTVQPERFRLGPLVQLLCRELPGRARVLPVAGHRLEIRGHAVLVDDELRAVPPAGMALLRALARRPGWVVARAELLRALPGAGRDEHAVETAMARLRAALGAPNLIQTVVKRGYRLSLDAGGEDKYGGLPRDAAVTARGVLG